MWLNREFFCNLYVGRVLIGQISRRHGVEQGWLGFLLDHGLVTDRVGWFATAEEARAQVEARVLSAESAVA